MESLLASGIKWTTDKLCSLLPSEVPASSLVMQCEAQDAALEDLKKLARTMKRIQCTLTDARQRDVRDHTEMHWLQELREVAYDAEDVVSDYDYDLLHAKIQARKKLMGKQCHKHQEMVVDLSSISVAVPVSMEIACRVKEVADSFEEITRVWEMLWWSSSDSSSQRGLNIMQRAPTGPLVQEDSIYGRHEDVENVIRCLFSDNGCNREGKLMVLPIIGMAGIGKTTLAQLIYNDVRVRENFDLMGWVSASGEFDVIDLTRNIITSFTKKNCDINQLGLVQIALAKQVEGKQFFLVLDDVWNEKQILLNFSIFITPLTKSRSGKILVTTRNNNVAKIIQTVPSYTLHDLKFEDSWSLFKQLVFDHEEKEIDENLKIIAQKIVTKCNGLPLVIKAIGSVCRSEYNVENLTNILESERWNDTRIGELLPILKSSYDHMPVHLKECYALLALFPKDHIFFEEMIIKLWMSLGYIHSDNGKCLEDIGKMYISELYGRSVIQRIDDMPCFVMHDLFHDLARHVAGNEVLRIEPQYIRAIDDEIQRVISFQFKSETRYVSILLSRDDETIALKNFQASQSLRLVRFSGLHGVNIEIPSDMFLNLRHIRALDFSHVSLKALPKSIGNLKQLRYLNLFNTELKFLPNSICSLHNLQTLEVTDCPISDFPNGIDELVNLRHLSFSSSYLSSLPYGIGLLTNLQTLTAFIVGENKCHIGELKHLIHLRETLHIMKFANATNRTNVPANLLKKHQLVREIILDWSSDVPIQQPELRMREIDELVLRSLEPNPSLVKLTINRYRGSLFPRWIGDVSFDKLVEVNLFSFICEFLPPLGQLPSLKFLTCKGGKKVSHVSREFFGYNATVRGFPSLEKLDFYGMEMWESWSGVKEGDFPNLNSLTICDCLELVSLPSPLSSTLKTMKIVYCERLARIPTLLSLEDLYLGGQVYEKFFIDIHLPQLRTMELSCVDNAEHLDINCCKFPVLEALTLRGCKNLQSLVGVTSLTSLKTLSIRKCPQLYISPDKQLPPSLESCEISDCRNVTYTKKG